MILEDSLIKRLVFTMGAFLTMTQFTYPAESDGVVLPRGATVSGTGGGSTINRMAPEAAVQGIGGGPAINTPPAPSIVPSNEGGGPAINH